MNLILLTLGVLIQILVLADIFKTIIFVNGGGFLSGFISKIVWKTLFIIARGNGKSQILNYCGPLILVSYLFSWITLIWLGYSLIFISDSNSIIDNKSGNPANIIGQIYYVGYTITSLGNGDYRAGNEVWQIVSNIMGINSMIFISLGISYLLPVLQAVVDKRTLAVYINRLGSTPNEIIKKGYNGETFVPLYQHFIAIESHLIKHAERHLAYPILFYFHTNNRSHSTPLSLAILDETITIQEIYNIDDSPKNYHWHFIKGALDNFYLHLDSNFFKSNDEVPPFNYKNKLPEKLGEKIMSDPIIELSEMNERRKIILGYIKNDGWSWDDVISSSKEKD